MVTVCGIDEAGRGPVIGPLVMCGVKVDETQNMYLQSLGVKDSKLLTPEQRERIFETLKQAVEYKLVVVSPQEIDKTITTPGLNLNWLEAIKTAEILNHLAPDKAIVDCPSVNIDAYTTYLRERLTNKKMVLLVEHKADLNHLVAGAASIIAKVTRDRMIAELRKSVGVDFGSGYPSDPLTQAFLKKNYNTHPSLFRKEWASYKDVAQQKQQKKLGEF